MTEEKEGARGMEKEEKTMTDKERMELIEKEFRKHERKGWIGCGMLWCLGAAFAVAAMILLRGEGGIHFWINFTMALTQSSAGVWAFRCAWRAGKK